MEQGMFILLLGVVLGCVVASGIWAVLWTLIKGDKRLQKDRIDIMRNIAVVCAEIDGSSCRTCRRRRSNFLIAPFGKDPQEPYRKHAFARCLLR